MSCETDPWRLERRVARGFDLLSPVYDSLLHLGLGSRIPESQTTFLDQIVDCRRALVVGGGSGRFLLELLGCGFTGSVVHLDISAGMTRRSCELVERRMPGARQRVCFVQGTVDSLRHADQFDLVCTHYFLDLFCTERLIATMRRLDRCLADEGLWICSDFAPPRGEATLYLLRQGLIRGLYQLFGLVCGISTRSLPPIESTFESLGYEALRSGTSCADLLWSALYARRTSLS